MAIFLTLIALRSLSWGLSDDTSEQVWRTGAVEKEHEDGILPNEPPTQLMSESEGARSRVPTQLRSLQKPKKRNARKKPQ
eukprot:scaffold653486_cov51-Prasinocladus_malaysianus.AAC.1